MDTRVRNRRRKLERRGEMLDCALGVFGERGFEGASMAEIAHRAGVVEGTLYLYFRNKRDLLDAVFVRFYEDAIASLEPRLRTLSGTRDRMATIIESHLRVPAEQPALAKLLLQDMRTHTGYFGTELHGLNRRYTRFFVDVLRQGQASGEIAPEIDARVVRDLVYGGIEHLTWRLIHGGVRIDVPTLTRSLTDMAMRAAGVMPVASPGVLAEARVPGGAEAVLARLDAAATRFETIASRLEQPCT